MENIHESEKRPHKLNDIQVSLLRMFNRDMSEQETTEVKRLLMRYYDEKLQAEVTRVEIEKGYTAADYDTMLNSSNRTATKQQLKRRSDESSY